MNPDQVLNVIRVAHTSFLYNFCSDIARADTGKAGPTMSGSEVRMEDEAHLGSCRRHISAARSQACHMGCWCVGGSRGWLTGVQLAPRMMRSASRKFRNNDATNKSCVDNKSNINEASVSRRL